MEQAVRITGAVLIGIAILLILVNLGVLLHSWIAPILLIALGAFALLFPHQVSEWRRERYERRCARRGDRD